MHAARVSAWGLIGKHLGMFVERRRQLGEDGQPVKQLFAVRAGRPAVPPRR